MPHLGQNLKLALLWAALAVALPPVVLLPAALLEVLLPFNLSEHASEGIAERLPLPLD